jgi:CheY-like chemotaxis protein
VRRSEENMTQQKRSRVLVADDEPQVREMTAESLSEAGYEVLCAASGEEALRIIDGNRDIALLLTDIKMPGMDGWSLARSAKEINPDLRIVYMTAYATLPPEGSGAGLGPVLAKPWRFSQLVRLIRAALPSHV